MDAIQTTKACQERKLMRDETWFRHRARELYHYEGQVEVDSDAEVSLGEDAGAYVQAWVWVDSGEDTVSPSDSVSRM